MTQQQKTHHLAVAAMLAAVAAVLQFVEISVPVMPGFVKLDLSDLPALLGARTVFQYRVWMYLLMTLVWGVLYRRNRKDLPELSLWLMPLLYLAGLKTVTLATTMITEHWQGLGLLIIGLELFRYARTREISPACAGMIAGLFMVLNISPREMSESIFSRLTTAPGSIRADINETTKRKKASFFRREISEAQAVLAASGREGKFPMVCMASLVLLPKDTAPMAISQLRNVHC